MTHGSSKHYSKVSSFYKVVKVKLEVFVFFLCEFLLKFLNTIYQRNTVMSYSDNDSCSSSSSKKENTNDDDIADVSTLRQFNFEPVIKRRTRKTNDKQ